MASAQQRRVVFVHSQPRFWRDLAELAQPPAPGEIAERMRGGRNAWVLQTYLWLRRRGLDAELATRCRAGRALRRPLRRPAGARSGGGQLPAGRAGRPAADAARGSTGGADTAAGERRQQPLHPQLAAAGSARARGGARRTGRARRLRRPGAEPRAGVPQPGIPPRARAAGLRAGAAGGSLVGLSRPRRGSRRAQGEPGEAAYASRRASS